MQSKDLGLALALIMTVALRPAFAASPKVGRPAPEFELTLLDGTKVKLSELRGQVVVLNFWATWCGPCKAEMPLLSAYKRRAERYGLQVYAVTTEDSLPLDQLTRVAKAASFPLVRRLKGPYDVMDGVPTNYVIDRAGILRYAKAAAFNLEALNDVLIPLLQESAPVSGPPPQDATAKTTPAQSPAS